jgi:hypothetical protein
MNLNAYDIAVIGSGFTILGALIGALATFYFAIELARRNAKWDAGRRLRESFAPELAVMHPDQGKQDVNVEQLLQTAFPRHSQAVMEFRFYLKEKEKQKFDRAWEAYWMVGGSVRSFDYYMGEDPRQVFLNRVNAILKFTET